MRSFTIGFEPEDAVELQVLAAETDTTMSELVRTLVAEALERRVDEPLPFCPEHRTRMSLHANKEDWLCLTLHCPNKVRFAR